MEIHIKVTMELSFQPPSDSKKMFNWIMTSLVEMWNKRALASLTGWHESCRCAQIYDSAFCFHSVSYKMHRDAPLVMCNSSKAETAQLPISSGMD